MSDEERHRFGVLLGEGDTDGIDLALLDPADEDERCLLIEAEHPELQRSIKERRREIRVGGDTINPAFHIAMHEIVVNQLRADDPPEVWATARRLVGDGYDRHEVLHMLASVVASEVFEVLRHEQHHDIERVRQALAALPGEWEQRRDERPAERHQNRADRRAAARRHRKLLPSTAARLGLLPTAGDPRSVGGPEARHGGPTPERRCRYRMRTHRNTAPAGWAGRTSPKAPQEGSPTRFVL